MNVRSNRMVTAWGGNLQFCRWGWWAPPLLFCGFQSGPRSTTAVHSDPSPCAYGGYPSPKKVHAFNVTHPTFFKSLVTWHVYIKLFTHCKTFHFQINNVKPVMTDLHAFMFSACCYDVVLRRIEFLCICTYIKVNFFSIWNLGWHQVRHYEWPCRNT